jgi:chromate transporter
MLNEENPSSGARKSGQLRSVAEVFVSALRLGLTSFGGPIAHLGYFREEYVIRRRWLDDSSYSQLIGLCQFLPGPTSSQLGFAIGWSRAGAIGALVAWCTFTLPSALLMFAFAHMATTWNTPLAQAAIHGLKIAAIAVVAQAVFSMARTLTPDIPRIAIGIAAAATTLLVDDPAVQILLIAAGAMAGMFLRAPIQSVPQRLSGRSPSRLLGLAALATFILLLVGLPILGSFNPWLGFADVFYRAGALVFGGGHVVLPLLREGLVPHWMNDGAFLSGYGAAQAMPGPLFSIASYLGGVINPKSPAFAAAVATGAIFAPGLLLAIGALAFRDNITESEWARRAVNGMNATVVGILSAALYNPLWLTGVSSLMDCGIAVVAFILLTRIGAPPIVAVALCVVGTTAAFL